MQLFYGVPEDIEIYGANAHKTLLKRVLDAEEL